MKKLLSRITIAALVGVFTVISTIFADGVSTVNITPMAVVEVEAATPKLNVSKKTITEGKTYQLKLSNASGTIKWSSSDKSVATVTSKGKVKALKPGKETITAKYKSKSYKCTVTVKAAKKTEQVTKQEGGSQTGAQGGSQTGTQGGGQTEAQDGGQTEVQGGSQTGTQGGGQTEAQGGGQTEAQGGSQTGTQGGSQTQTDVDRQVLEIYNKAEKCDDCNHVYRGEAYTKADIDEALKEFLYAASLRSYWVNDIKELRSVDAYNAMYPEAGGLTYYIEEVHKSGFFVVFERETTPSRSSAFQYAIRTGDYSILKSERDKQACDKLIELANSPELVGRSNIDKLLYIHDYLVLNTAYAWEEFKANRVPDSCYTVAGLLLDGRAVCQGYAETFCILANMLGMPATVVSGTANGGSHAWNQVQVDGVWYNMDVTWDDPAPDTPGRVIYNYFLVSDAKLAKNHSWKSTGITCSVDYNYELQKYKDYIITDLAQVPGMIDAQSGNSESNYIFIYRQDDASVTFDSIAQAFMDYTRRGIKYYYPVELGDYYKFEIFR